MLNDPNTEAALEDPSMLLFGDLPIRDLEAAFTDSQAKELAQHVGLNATTVSSLANEVTRQKRQLGLASRRPRR